MNDRNKGRLILGAMCATFIALPLWLANWTMSEFAESVRRGFQPEHPQTAYELPTRCVTDTDCQRYAETAIEPEPLPDDLSNAALIEWTRQSIRSHGPVRRNCVKRQHGFIVPENFTPSVVFHHREPVIESPLPEASPPMLAEASPPMLAEASEPVRDYTGLPSAYYFEPLARVDAREPVQVPEPDTLGLLGLALVLGAVFRRKVLP